MFHLYLALWIFKSLHKPLKTLKLNQRGTQNRLMHLFILTLGTVGYVPIKIVLSQPKNRICRHKQTFSHLFSLIPFFAPSTDLKPQPPQSRRNTLSCLKGADSISIVPSSEAASQLSSPAAGPSRSDASGCHGRRGMMQAIKNERRASKVRLKSGAEQFNVFKD